MSRKTERVISFSQKEIEALIPPAKDRVDWWDDSTPNLVCRVSSSGSKSFYWIGRAAGEWKRVKLGDWPQMNCQGARTEARRISGLAAIGADTATRAKVASREWTLQELFDWYLNAMAIPHKRTWKWDLRNYETRMKDRWGSKRVSRITKTEIHAVHLKVGEENGKYAANKVLELLGTMYRKGADLYPDRVPCPDPTRGIPRFPREERERFLDGDELPRFLAEVPKLQRQRTRDFVMMALYTGARRANLCAMKWVDISLRHRVWTIDKSESKNKRTMSIVLSDQAIEILKRRRAETVGPWVFPGDGPTGHFNNPKDAIYQTCKRAGLKDVRFHDLRRTLGSWMAVDNPLHVIGKQLGHKSQKATAIYARLANKSLIDAVGTVTAAMESMGAKYVASQPAKATKPKRKRATKKS